MGVTLKAQCLLAQHFVAKDLPKESGRNGERGHRGATIVPKTRSDTGCSDRSCSARYNPWDFQHGIGHFTARLIKILQAHLPKSANAYRTRGAVKGTALAAPSNASNARSRKERRAVPVELPVGSAGFRVCWHARTAGRSVGVCAAASRTPYGGMRSTPRDRGRMRWVRVLGARPPTRGLRISGES